MMTLITRAGTLSQGIFERLLQSCVKKAITCRSGAFAFRIVGTWYCVANVLLQPRVSTVVMMVVVVVVVLLLLQLI
jgi:hypothetical protein